MRYGWTGFVIGLLVFGLAGTGAAVDFGTVMDDVAEEKCWEDTDHEFGDALLMFPYLPATGDWWGGISLVNLDPAENIPANALCFVGVNANGDGFVKVHAYPLYARNMLSLLKEDIDPDNDKWKDALYLGVYRRKSGYGPTAKLRAFAMMGDTSQAHGAFFLPKDTDNRPAESVRMNYFPGEGWWSGIAVVNTSEDKAELKLTVIQNGIATETEKLSISGKKMLIMTPEQINAQARETVWDPAARAFLEITKADGADDLAIYATALFGNGDEAAGYFAEKVD